MPQAPAPHLHPRPGAPRVRVSSPPMPQTPAPLPTGRGGQPRRPGLPVPVRRRTEPTSAWNLQAPPLYVPFVPPRMRRFASLMRRGLAKIPVLGGLAPIRDIRFDFAELRPSWRFSDLSPVWTFRELTTSWRYTEPPIDWTFDELNASWSFTEPPTRG